MLLESLQNFEWYNEPANVVFQDQELCVTSSEKTDFWQSRHHGYSKDNGHFFFSRCEEDFTFLAKWHFSNPEAYNQCGIMVRIDENNWIKAAIIYDTPTRPMIGTSVTQNGYSDWAAQDISFDQNEVWFKLKKQQGDYLVYYSLDGLNYKQMRMSHLINDIEEVKVGAYICSPNTKFEASLSEIELKK